jgi:hypothetical protein
MHYCEVFVATNPCAEEFLPDYGCCCLGSINLTGWLSRRSPGRRRSILTALPDLLGSALAAPLP